MLDIELRSYIDTNNQTENELRALDPDIQIDYTEKGIMLVFSEVLSGYVSTRDSGRHHYLKIVAKDKGEMEIDLEDIDTIWNM